MMSKITKGAKLLAEHVMAVKPGEEVVVVADAYARPMLLGQAFYDAVSSLGARPTLGIMPAPEYNGQEPPRAIAAAMEAADVVLLIHEAHPLAHTNARKRAAELGKRVYIAKTDMGEDYYARDITADDLTAIRERTEAVAKRFEDGKVARLTTPLGTDLTVDIAGRPGVALHPFTTVLGGIPDYAEATIAPNEGKSYGKVVIDSHMIGWGFLLREPLRVRVEAGRCVEVEGDSENAEQLRRIVFGAENSDNCPAEFAIGTSHTIPESVNSERYLAGRCGLAHIAFGRNNDIGGATWSKTHIDGVMRNATITVDGETILQDGKLLI